MKQVISEIRENQHKISASQGNDTLAQIAKNLKTIDEIIENVHVAQQENSPLRVNLDTFASELEDSDRVEINKLLDEYLTRTRKND